MHPGGDRARGGSCLDRHRHIDESGKNHSKLTPTMAPRWILKTLTKSNIPLEFDKDLRAQATSADSFNTKGTHVIVYYFGEGIQRTAVALQGLASGPLKRTIGTVVKFDKHQRLLTVESAPGGVQSFHIDSKTVVETSVGAVEGRRFDPQKGDQVRVTAAPAQGTGTALFIYAK